MRKEGAMDRINAIYARQSVDKVDSISIESQIDYCKYEIRGEPYKEYKDKGYSGKNTDRPQFQEMLDAIRNGEIKRVVCYKLDRISRSILDFANMMEEFQTHGVEFVSCTEKFDTSTPMGRAMLNICIVFAQLERETIQQRVIDAYNSRSRKGFYMGGRVPYGYKLEPYMIDGKKTSRYVIEPEEAKIVRLIYSLYAEPQISYGDIVKYLIEHNIHNDRLPEGCWDKARIADMMKNPIYVKADFDVYSFFKAQGAELHNNPEDFIGTNGCYLYADKDGKRKTVCLEKHHIVLAPHEGIVSSDLWLRARVKCLGNKQVARPLKAKNTWLAGKIKCGKCGYALTVRKAKTRIGRYFICSRHMQTDIGCEGVGGLNASEIESLILDAMKDKLRQFETLSSTQKAVENPHIAELNIRIMQIKSEIDSLIDKLAMADEVLTEYIRKRVSELDAKKKQLQADLRQLDPLKNGNKCNVTEITDYMSNWEELTIEDKMSVVDVLISAIHATESDIEIAWKF